MAADDLTELRGLHGPPMDAGGALAEGAVALAAGLMAAWAVSAAVGALTMRAPSPERTALHRLKAIGEDASDRGLAARARILHDLAMTLPSGEGDWLARLDAHLEGLFSRGDGRGLREALYRPDAPFEPARFDAALRAALERAER